MAFAEISVQQAAELLRGENPPRLVDCREPAEYDVCKIEGAELIPYPTFMGQATSKLTDPKESILIYCHHGIRSAYAASFLTEMGYEDVKTMAGGIEAWAEEIDPAMKHY